MDSVRILNLTIDNISLSKLLERLHHGAVFTPNVDHLILLQRDDQFADLYSRAAFKICDSQVLVYASQFLGTPFKEKISGSDLFPAFYRFHQQDPSITIFLLGAMEGVAARAQQRINEKVGRNIVVGTYSPPFGFEKDPQECSRILEIVKASGATVLAVGLGAHPNRRSLSIDSATICLAFASSWRSVPPSISRLAPFGGLHPG